MHHKHHHHRDNHRDPHTHFFGRFGGGGPGGSRGPASFFERFGGMGGGGRGGIRGGRVLSSDDLQLIILALLQEKPSHGYELIKALTEKSSGIYTPSPGMIYPALTYLEEVSYAVSETEGTKKLFSITDEGKKFLEQNRQQADVTLENLSAYGQRMAHFRDQMNQEEETEEKWGGSPKEQQKKEWRQLKSEFREIRDELKMAIFEKFNAPLEEKKRVLKVLKDAIKEIRGK